MNFVSFPLFSVFLMFPHDWIEVLHFESNTTLVPHIRRHTMSVCLSFSDVKIDPLAKVVSAMFIHCNINFFLVLSNMFCLNILFLINSYAVGLAFIDDSCLNQVLL